MSIFSKKNNQVVNSTEKKKLKIEKYNKLVAENTSDFVAITDFSINAKYLYVNLAYAKFLGYSREEMLSKKGMDIIHPDDKKKLKPLLLKYLKEKTFTIFNKKSTEVSEKIEYRVKNNKENWCLLSSTVNLVDDKLLFVSRDITEQKKAEEKVEEEKRKVQAYLNLVGVIILALDKAGNVTLINKTGSKVLGYQESKIIGKNWFDNFIPEEQCQTMKKVFAKLMSGEEEIVECHENEITIKSGEKRLVVWHNTFLKDDKGEVTGVLSSGDDITERKKMEERIIISEEEWSEIFDSMSDGVSLHNPNHIIVNTNQALCNLLGKTKEEIIGKKCFSIFHDKNQPIAECPMNVTLKNKTAKRVEIFEPKLNKWLSVYTSPIVNKEGQVVKIIHVVRDITERKNTEKEIVKRNQELEKFNSLMVGRESRMVDLKKKIKKLEGEINNLK